MSYKLHHRRTGKQMLDNQSSAGRRIRRRRIAAPARNNRRAYMNAMNCGSKTRACRQSAASPLPIQLPKAGFRASKPSTGGTRRLRQAHSPRGRRGALGNEIIKNLCLLGVGNVVIVGHGSVN